MELTSGHHIKIVGAGRSYRVDLQTETLWREGEERVRLTGRQWSLLKFFAENPGRLIRKAELVQRIWGTAAVTDEAISQAVRGLRGALGDTTACFIVTDHGRGYRLVAEVSTHQETTPVTTSPLTSLDVDKLVAKATAAARPGNILVHAIPGEVIKRALAGVTCRAFGLKAEDVTEIQVSVEGQDVIDNEAFIEFYPDVSFIRLASGLTVGIPERALEDIARGMAVDYPDYTPLCVQAMIPGVRLAERRPLTDSAVEFYFVRRLELMSDSELEDLAITVVKDPPHVRSDHFWRGQTDTLYSSNGQTLGPTLLDRLATAGRLDSLLEAVTDEHWLWDNRDSRMGFTWALVEHHPDVVRRHPDWVRGLWNEDTPLHLSKTIDKILQD